MTTTIYPGFSADGNLRTNTDETKQNIARSLNSSQKNVLHFAASYVPDGGGTVVDVPDDVGDSTPMFIAADAAANGSGLTAPKLTYRCKTNCTISNHITCESGSLIRVESGATLTLEGGYTADPKQQVFDIELGGNVVLSPKCNPTPQHFGAKEDGSDSSQALNAFFTAVGNSDILTVDIGGQFSAASTVYMQAGTSTLPKVWQGCFQLTSLAAMDKLLVLKQLHYHKINKIKVRGTGKQATNSFASRTTLVGVYLDNCQRLEVMGIEADLFGFAAFLTNHAVNNNLCIIRRVDAHDCGTGYISPSTGASLVGNWSNPINSGLMASYEQRTKIDVTQLPPDWVTDERLVGPVGTFPHLIRIADKLHYIMSVDESNSQLEVFPWIPSGATPGNFEYVTGGGCVLVGSDSNVFSGLNIDATRCGIGFQNATLYQAQCDQLHMQACGAAVTIGRTRNGVALGGSIASLYMELCNEEVVFVAPPSSVANTVITSAPALRIEKCYSIGQPNNTSGEPQLTYGAMQRGTLSYKGTRLEYEQPPGNKNATGSSVRVNLSRSDQTLFLVRDSTQLFPDAPEDQVMRFTGWDHVHCTMIGTAPDKIPTGVLDIRAPTGWTVEGSPVQHVRENFTDYLEFVYQYLAATKDIKVHMLRGGGTVVYGPDANLARWTQSGAGFVQDGASSILATVGTYMMYLPEYVMDQAVEYDLSFDVTESTVNLGVAVSLVGPTGLGNYYPTLTAYGDQAVSFSGVYITSNGRFHSKLTLPANLPLYRLRLSRVNTHTGTQKISNIKLGVTPV